MFRALIPPIFRSTRLCVTACGNTQSSAPEDGRDQCPKHVELIGINKPLLLHLLGVYIVYINDARSNKYRMSITSEIGPCS